MGNQIGITKGLNSWQFQSTYVERAMDNAAYQAAHPDDTLVLAGPARRGSALGGNGTGIQTLLAIGMLQSLSFTQTKPTQPLLAIGSGRSFFVSGKSQTQWSIARLFVNGRNLLRVLYHNFVAAGGDPTAFDDQVALKQKGIFFTNLDSELYYVPFGLGTIFRNKAHDLLGAIYAELSMISSYAIGINAGQNMVLENVTGLSDRLLPWGNIADSAASYMPRATLDEILDFTENPAPVDGEIGDEADTRVTLS
jgi:hypothetical protein